MLCVVALFNIIKGVLLMTMGDCYRNAFTWEFVFDYGVSQIGASYIILIRLAS